MRGCRGGSSAARLLLHLVQRRTVPQRVQVADLLLQSGSTRIQAAVTKHALVPGRGDRSPERRPSRRVAPRVQEHAVLQAPASGRAVADVTLQQRPQPSFARTRNVRQAREAAVARGRRARDDALLHRGVAVLRRRRRVRPTAEEQGVGGGAERPDVDLGAVPPAGGYLRRHVRRRAENAREACRLEAARTARQAEVAQLHGEPRRGICGRGDGEEVVRFHVAMHDAGGMASGDADCHVLKYPLHLLLA
mmetsp:Transcript_15405/g.44535  ORF Transcript_15405/g.44535 Transcript_15405/m.44535 type:complete len:249 (-) Transcript_15405:458-1204(-)